MLISLIVIIITLPIAYLTFKYQSKSEAAWFDSGWHYRKRMTFNNSAQSSNLSNFPVLVTLSVSNFDFSQAKDNGEDIRFTDSDGTTQLNYEIQKYDKANQQALIWVNVPQINASSSTDYIFIYYGNANAVDGQNTDGAWNSNYKGVYHLDDNAGSTTVIDSSGNGNDLTTGENTTKYYSSNGQLNNSFITAGTPTRTDNQGGSDSGVFPDIELDSNGYPVIAYTDNTDLDLILVHCNDKDCKGNDESFQVVYSTGNTGYYPSLKLDSNGYPVIAFYDSSGGDLKLIHCNDVNCADGDDAINTVESTNDTGYYPSLQLDGNGYPVISYYYGTGADLKLAHCNDVNCADSNETINTVDSTGTVGNYGNGNSLVLDGSGNPVIAYNDDTNNDLKIAHCNDANCDGTGESITSPLSASADDSGIYSKALQLDASGFPMVSFVSITATPTYYSTFLHCDDVNCAGDETANRATIYAGTAYYSDMKKNSSGNPVIFTLAGNVYPYIVTCSSTACSSVTQTTLTNYSQYSIAGLSMTLDTSNNVYAVSYNYGEEGFYDTVLYTTESKISRSYDSDFNFGTGSFSTSLWFKSNDDTQLNYLLSRYDNDQGYKIWVDYAGQPCFGIEDDSSWGPDDAACTTPASIIQNIDNSQAGSATYVDFVLDSNGYPVIAYYDDTPDDLEIIHCNDANCAGYNESYANVDTSANSVGLYPSIKLDAAGKPVIAYYDATDTNLKVVHCGDVNCSTGNVINAIDVAATAVGLYPALQIDSNGYPVIGYYDATNTAIKLVHCNDVNCSGGDESIVTVDNTEYDMPYLTATWMQLDSSGYPVMAYVDYTNYDLKIAHCTDANCTGVNLNKPDTSGTTGFFPSLQLDTNGYPVIAYQYSSGGNLRLMHCNDANCAGGNETISTFPTDSLGYHGYYHIDLDLTSAGYPVISHTQLADWNVLVTVCNDVNCAGNNETTSEVRENSYNYVYSSLELDASNKPVVLTRRVGDLSLLHFSNTTSYTDTNRGDTNTWHHLVAVKNGTSSISLYIDGVLAATDASLTATGTLTSDSAAFRLAEDMINNLSVYNWRGQIDEVQVDSTARSADWVAAEYLSETNTFITFDIPEVKDQPVAFWKFDEGTGTTTKDSTTKNHTATLVSGTTWQTEEMCASGKCLKFDGSNDYVSMGTGADYFPMNTFSICSWVKSPGLASGMSLNGIISLTYGLTVSLDSNGAIYTRIDNGTSLIGYTIGGNLYDNNWHQVCLAYDGTNQHIYTDGVEKGSSAVGWLGTTRWPTNGVNVGHENNNPAIYKFNGFIDEVKIYNYYRTAEQIKSDFTSKSSDVAKGTSVQMGTNVKNNDALSDGLVTYLKMDESAANTCTGGVNDSCDASGNTIDGAWLGSANTTAGKFGNGVSFDNAGDVVGLGSPATLDFGNNGSFTFAGWIKPTTLADYDAFISKDTVTRTAPYSYMTVFMADGRLTVYNSSSWITLCAAGSVVTGSWQHVVFNYDGTNITGYVNGQACGSVAFTYPDNAAYEVSVGSWYAPSTAYDFNGVMDEIRIYNRPLSPKEVRDLYAWAPGPVGYWNMEEKTGATAQDFSGNGFNGTITGASWATGKYGASLSFDGTTGYVSVADNSNLDITEASTYQAWLKYSANGASNERIFSKGETGTNYGCYLFKSSGAKTIGFGSSAGYVTTTGSFGDGLWHHIAGVHTGGKNNASLFIYVDGILQATSATGTFAGCVATSEPLVIGGHSDDSSIVADRRFAGAIDEAKIYNYARTPKQIVGDMNADHPAGGSPIGSQVAYYKLDEGYGTVANNSGNQGSSLNATTYNSTPWSQNGKNGKALNYDGSSNYYAQSNTDYLFNDDQAFSTWIYPTNVTGLRGILATHNYASNSNFGLNICNTGKIGISIGYTDETREFCTKLSAATLTTNQWYHLILTYSLSNNTVKLFINGVLDSTWTLTKTAKFTTGRILIGQWSNNLIGSYLFSGLIDEVKVYNYALTEDEIKLDYNQGSVMVLGAMGSNTSYEKQSANQEFCVPGDSASCVAPIAEWKMDEKTGTTANDTSGNNRNVSFTNSPTWASAAQCKQGACLDFDNDDYASLDWADFSLGPQTIEFWMNADTITAGYRDLVGTTLNTDTNRFHLHATDNSIIFYSVLGACGNLDSDVIPTAGQWYHVAGTTDGANMKIYVNGQLKKSSACVTASYTSTGIWIGGTTEDFDGKIDHVKIFDYARTPAQIAYDFNRGAPVGWWKMDECQGVVVYDSAATSDVAGNNGTISIGATGSQTAVGTCTTSGTAWGNGATGKYNSSLSFDGTDDHAAVNISNIGFQTIHGPSSISLWFNASALSGTKYIFSDNCFEWGIYHNGTTLYGATYAGASAGTISTGQWYHAVLTHEHPNGLTNTVVKIYLNGVLKNQNTWTYSTENGYTDSPYYIGDDNCAADRNFAGQIDDVRVFNYGLTTEQVKNLYNAGAAVQFAPVTGSP